MRTQLTEHLKQMGLANERKGGIHLPPALFAQAQLGGVRDSSAAQ